MDEMNAEIQIEEGTPEPADVEMDWSRAQLGTHRDVAHQATPVHVELPKRSYRSAPVLAEDAVREESTRLKFADMEEILETPLEEPEEFKEVKEPSVDEAAREDQERRDAFKDQSTVSFGVEHLLGGLPSLAGADPDEGSAWEEAVPEQRASHEETRLLAQMPESFDERDEPSVPGDTIAMTAITVESDQSSEEPLTTEEDSHLIAPPIAPVPVMSVEVASIARDHYMTTADDALRDYVYNARRIGKTDPERAIRLLEVKRDELDEMKRVWVYGELACLHCRQGLKKRDRNRIREGLGLLNKARICASDPESAEVERHFWNTLGPRMLQTMSFVDLPNEGASSGNTASLEARLEALTAQVASLVSSEHAGGRTRLERVELRLGFLDRGFGSLRKKLGRINDRYTEQNDSEGSFYTKIFERKEQGEPLTVEELEEYCRVLDAKLDVIVGALVHATRD